jgi:hypothetical protein
MEADVGRWSGICALFTDLKKSFKLNFVFQFFNRIKLKT